jgi:hypothetical protein
MTEAGRVLYAGLHLLDRQLLDRDGTFVGNVDDAELTFSEDTGELYVTAILAGPGVLLHRMGRTRLGAWLQRVHAFASSEAGDASRIAFGNVMDIGDDVKLAVDGETLATTASKRWVRDHVIAHIPGSRHEAGSS